MSRSTASHDAAHQTERFERGLLASLGLGPGASNEQIESAHDAVVRFLDDAPAGIRGWAGAQEAAADESYALLRGPREDLVAAAAAHAPAAPAPAAPAPANPAPVPTNRSAATAEDVDWEAEPEAETRPKGRSRRDTASSRERRNLAPIPSAGRGVMVRRLGIAAVAIGSIAVAFAVYNLGAPAVPAFTGSPAPESSAAATVDQAKVSELMQALSTNPNDINTLQQLGDLYYGAGDYATAATWMDKILAIDPKNVTGLLALGAADFNVGKLTEAETSWRQVLAIDSKNLEAHYDLGFMYLSKNPPDMVNVKAEWNEVIAIAPDSDVAKTVATHLQSLDGSPAPSAGSSVGPAVSASPSAAATPAPSAAATPAPSVAPSPSAGG